MKRKRTYCKIILCICISLLTGYANGQDANPCKTGGQTCYFGIEMNNTLCGYSIETYCTGMWNGKKVRYEYSDVILKMSLLGSEMDAGIKILYVIDPVTDRAVKIEVSVINGQSVVKSTTNITRDTAFYINSTSGVNKTLPAGKEVLFTSLTRYPYLFDDFIKKRIASKKYLVFDPLKGEVVEKGYLRKSEEDVTLNDSVFHAVILEETDYSTGITTTLWLNKADGYNVKTAVAGRLIYLADKSVMGRIAMADMNKMLFAKVGKIIPEFLSVTRMKVKAEINTYGETLTPEKLNFPGQNFTGSVTGSLIEGIFEIEPIKYNGNNAPPYPSEFKKNVELKRYLEPEMMIESDDPLIVSEAKKIADGSKNSWEATVRLCQWVAEKITYALPGGGSAINTFKTGEAECGGHSRLLVAFCRAVGIPARLAIGCIYTTNYAGSFGQHAWTEVFMGDAGWIAVDATLNEKDYTDAGHIRLGEKSTFYPKTMEILEYNSTKSLSLQADKTVPDKYIQLLGSYANLEQFMFLKVGYRDSGLYLDIPGQINLPLYEPDEKGQWYPKVSRLLSISFRQNHDGKVEKLIMSKYAPMKKMSEPDSVSADIPVDLKTCVGNYTFPQAKLSLDVSYSDGFLTMPDPIKKSDGIVRFRNINDYWVNEKGNYEVRFDKDQNQEVVRMNLAVRVEFERGEPISDLIVPMIEKSGIEAGLNKYDETKKSGNTEYLFSEHMLHNLGHKMLNENRIDDALKIFIKNVQEYPDSFMANDALAETYLKKGEDKLALKYFKAAVKLNPDYDYGREMIKEINNNK